MLCAGSDRTDSIVRLARSITPRSARRRHRPRPACGHRPRAPARAGKTAGRSFRQSTGSHGRHSAIDRATLDNAQPAGPERRHDARRATRQDDEPDRVGADLESIDDRDRSIAIGDQENLIGGLVERKQLAIVRQNCEVRQSLADVVLSGDPRWDTVSITEMSYRCAGWRPAVSGRYRRTRGQPAAALDSRARSRTPGSLTVRRRQRRARARPLERSTERTKTWSSRRLLV